MLDATVIPCSHASVTSLIKKLETAGLQAVAANIRAAVDQDVAEGKPLKSMSVRADHLWYGRFCMGEVS